ncbi:MAG: hypothetical protein LBP76_08720 [Treponema sp.]|jgi:hypothetical protein|nr:hypothetical protein [Treponema sp.]
MEKQRMRASRIKDIESELNKDAEDIDGDFIDRRIDELCALDGLNPPKLSGAALDAAARTIRSRAAWRRGNTRVRREQKSRFTRRALRGTLAACGVFLLLFSVNYLSALVTGSCLPAKAGVKFCCGTKYCVCEVAKGEDEHPGDRVP